MSPVLLSLAVVAGTFGLALLNEHRRKRERARGIRHLREYLTRMERW